MRNKRLQQFSLLVLPWLLSWIMRAWFATCRVNRHNTELLGPIKRGEEGVNIVASFWHYSIIYLLYFLRNHPATIMVSASDDGEYIARLGKQFGFTSVRGSRNSKGVEALKGMLRAVRGGRSGAVVADGSQGPPRKAQPGALLVAVKTGRPIVPMAWAASNCIIIGSWDKTAIPKPFSKIDVIFGDPIYLPKKLSSEELEEYRIVLEDQLNRLYTRAWEKYGKAVHDG